MLSDILTVFEKTEALVPPHALQGTHFNQMAKQNEYETREVVYQR
jgi:hypothetical protein